MLNVKSSIRLRLTVILLMLTGLVIASALTGLHVMGVYADHQQNLDMVDENHIAIYRLVALAEKIHLPENAAPTEKQSPVDEIKDGIKEFDRNYQELRGDKNAVAGRITSPHILPMLDEMGRSWENHREMLLKYINSSYDEREGLLKVISDQATTLSSYIERVDVAILQDTEAANSSARQAFTLIFALTLIALLGSGYVLYGMVKGMNGLSHVAQTLASGDYSARAQPNKLVEIAAMGRAFNAMADTVQLRETELKQLNATLELRVDERTKELRKANAVAQESVRLKSEFMSTMSHELRTPLNAIIGFCGIMLEGMGGEIDDDARHMLDRINGNSTRLLSLINEVLDLAKIEAGRLELVSEPMSVHALVERWRSQTAVLAEQKGLTFDVEIDPRLPATLYGDAERLTQIAVNLLSNAFKFTEKGGVNLALGRLDGMWLMQVSDTGIGIPPHAINYIFDEFRQVDGSSRRVYGGTGLGLSIVRHLSRMMNGSVSVTSDLGKGSVFTVKLPLVAGEAVETKIPVLEMAQA